MFCEIRRKQRVAWLISWEIEITRVPGWRPSRSNGVESLESFPEETNKEMKTGFLSISVEFSYNYCEYGRQIQQILISKTHYAFIHPSCDWIRRSAIASSLVTLWVCLLTISLLDWIWIHSIRKPNWRRWPVPQKLRFANGYVGNCWWVEHHDHA